MDWNDIPNLLVEGVDSRLLNRGQDRGIAEATPEIVI